jgi:hypothetical protein
MIAAAACASLRNGHQLLKKVEQADRECKMHRYDNVLGKSIIELSS